MRISRVLLPLQLAVACAARAQQADTPPPKPGLLLRSETIIDRSLPAGARAWRILYSTTLNDSMKTVASAIVLTAAQLPPGPRPVVAWAHGTLGIAGKCDPSLASPPVSRVPALDQIVAKGWVLVATDYAGPGASGVHPYLVGEGEARAALDAVRAAKQIRELALDHRTVAWGHSEGGHAALWEGILAPSYAPDVDIVGVVADSPLSDMAEVLGIHAKDPTGALLGAYVATTYSRLYPDVVFDRVVRPEARDVAHQLATFCSLAESADFVGPLLTHLRGASLLLDPEDGVLGKRLRENAPQQLIDAPLLIVHGRSDTTVPLRSQDRYVDERCEAGQRLEYWTVTGADHGTIDAAGSPLGAMLIRWTEDRFAGVPQQPGCRRTTIARP
jgi:pimeloyl-ACP methyl ester carboxylesterase